MTTFPDALYDQYVKRGFHVVKIDVTNDDPVAVLIKMGGMTMLIDARRLEGVAAHCGVTAYDLDGHACRIDHMEPSDGSALFNVITPERA